MFLWELQEHSKNTKSQLKRYHLEYDENIVFDATDSSYQHGYEITKKILPIIPSIDAIQYSTDDIAIGGMMCLQEKGMQDPRRYFNSGTKSIYLVRIYLTCSYYIRRNK